ncbi:tetratricopeptide repeat protein [Baaleninema sp.]|uniref:tetratricopeptide repeat protein n=1 Tax=Baaleninema sp. TaxID=3101197 RepID=UPI003D034A7A
MKLQHASLFLLSTLLVSVEAATAQTPPDTAPTAPQPETVTPPQPTATPTPIPQPPAPPAAVQTAPAAPAPAAIDRSEIERIVEESLEDSDAVRDAIDNAVDDNFSWTFSLLNILLLLLILFPIVGIILLWTMRRNAIDQVVEIVEDRLSHDLKDEVSRELKAEFETRPSLPDGGGALATQEPGQLKDMVSMALSVQNVMDNARHTIENSMDLQERLGTRLKDVFEMHLRQGRELAAAGQHTEALAAFDKAIEIDGGHPLPFCERGAVYAQLQRFEEALSSYDRAIEVSPDFPNGWYGKARCFALVGYGEQAIENLKKAIELNSELKAQAQSNPDFASIRENEWFQTAVVG